MSEKIALPFSIIIAGALIGGGIYMNGKIEKENPTKDQERKALSREVSDLIDPITADDHVLGSPDARILIVEYSDTECPYCKDFHNTLNSVMQEYGQEGKVAWVYRHNPISELHPKAFKEAEALECATELGGNSKFWEYANELYRITPSNDGLDPAELPKIAATVGLSVESFNTCLQSGRMTERVEKDKKDAYELELSGTPSSFIIDTKKQEYYPMQGYYPFPQTKQVIDMILGS